MLRYSQASPSLSVRATATCLLLLASQNPAVLVQIHTMKALSTPYPSASGLHASRPCRFPGSLAHREDPLCIPTLAVGSSISKQHHPRIHIQSPSVIDQSLAPLSRLENAKSNIFFLLSHDNSPLALQTNKQKRPVSIDLKRWLSKILGFHLRKRHSSMQLSVAATPTLCRSRGSGAAS
jgi:hypothetical protein